MQLRAVFNGGENAAGVSVPATTTYSRFAGGPNDAAEQIGPTTVDLLTGSLTITRTDVSIPVPGFQSNLEFTRTYSSAYATSEKTNSNVLGGMWQPSPRWKPNTKEKPGRNCWSSTPTRSRRNTNSAHGMKKQKRKAVKNVLMVSVNRARNRTVKGG